MRIIKAEEITLAVSSLCIDSNLFLPASLQQQIADAEENEKSTIGKSILSDLTKNLDAAKMMKLPICQDTGMVVVFAEVGQDLHIDGDFEEAINCGVSKGYLEGYLRCSVVADPLRRVNTNDNTPAVIHTKLVSGDKLQLMVAPKGFGSENMSRMKMLTPAATDDDIIEIVVETVLSAGSNPCPPIVIGVGIGGDFEYCAYLAKKALCRDVCIRNQDPYYSDMEARILVAVNALGIGPQGFGGNTTALAVQIETFPTHIAGLPVAVNIGCHVTRHQSVTL